MMLKRILIVLLLHSICLPVFSKVYTIESIPNPKITYGGYVSDPDNLLASETITQINSILTNLEQTTSNQVALVVIGSIGDEVPKDFAYRLFNLWGIGLKGKDNGLLMLMVMDQRRIEFETGYGMESVLPDATCKSIQMTYMVPRFKEGDYDGGLLEGLKATVDIMQNEENSAYFLEMNAPLEEDLELKITWTWIISIGFAIVLLIVFFAKKSTKSFADLYQHATKEEQAKVGIVISKTRWFILYVLPPALIMLYMNILYFGNYYFLILVGIFYSYFLFLFIEKRLRSNTQMKTILKENDFYGNYNKYTSAHSNWWLVAIFFPLPFVFYFIYYSIEKNKLRNHPRNCKKCSNALQKLDEVGDDSHLSKGQLMEESLKSVDYDVWYCDGCQSKEVLSYKSLFSKYSECEKCTTRAYYMHSDVTLVSATYDSTGTGEKTYKCKFCGISKSQTYTIAKKVKSSSSSGGGGSSFGGGSSGGGGSGSSW